MIGATKRNLFWHFAAEDRRLCNCDRRKIIVGRTLKVKPPIKLCESGLHASYHAMDALAYSSGPIICRVRMGGGFIAGDDKVVASERTTLAIADATTVLHEFACWCAERALTAAGVKDERCWSAVEVKRQWLRGEANEKDLAAAWSAAKSAADLEAQAEANSAEYSVALEVALEVAYAAQNTQLESVLKQLLSRNYA